MLINHELILGVFVFLCVFFIGIIPVIKKADELDYDNRRKMQMMGHHNTSWVIQMKDRVVGIASKILGMEKYDKIKLLLVQAGMDKTIPESLYAIGLACGAGFAILGGTIFRYTGTMAIIIAIGLAIFGFNIPQIYVKMKANVRIENIQYGVLPFVELLYAQCEAGMDLDYAILRISKTSNGDLAKEFRRTWNEFKQRDATEAMKGMIERCGSDDVRLLLEAIMQTKKTGVPMSKTLREQSERIRESVANKITNKGEKIGVKILMPTMILEMPALLLILLAPMAMYLSKALGSGMDF